MTTMLLQTLKGFRDFLPLEAKKRQFVIDTLKRVFESYGFEPLETPALEYEDILTGKYGEEGDKLMYRFEDNGGRKVAMRYDQTVPTARVVAQYQNHLPFPFKRYQIQPVWRAENTQKGRYREFVQCDVDTFGVSSAESDAEIIATAVAGLQALGFKTFRVLINDRTIFANLPPVAITIIDKLKKIGTDRVCEELVEKNVTTHLQDAARLLETLITTKPTERLNAIFTALSQMEINSENYVFSPTLARGLNYYTGMIFEIETPDYSAGSLCGGGRYDNLTGMFAKKNIPAVGLAFGFDRTIEAMEALDLFPKMLLVSQTKVLVTVFSKQYQNASLQITTALRKLGVNTEMFLGEMKATSSLEKQLKYADQKKIPFVILMGPEEIEKNHVTLKNLQTRKQTTQSLSATLSLLQAS